MPISIEEFEAHEPTDRTDGERIVRFLARNRDKAYEAEELATETDVPSESIRTVLHRLAETGLVRHKEPYWALGDPDAVREATVFSSAAAHLDTELGPESRSEWLSAAERSDE